MSKRKCYKVERELRHRKPNLVSKYEQIPHCRVRIYEEYDLRTHLMRTDGHADNNGFIQIGREERRGEILVVQCGRVPPFCLNPVMMVK